MLTVCRSHWAKLNEKQVVKFEEKKYIVCLRVLSHPGHSKVPRQVHKQLLALPVHAASKVVVGLWEEDGGPTQKTPRLGKNNSSAYLTVVAVITNVLII